MMKTKHIKLAGLFCFLISMILVGTAVFIPRLLDVNAYREEILLKLRQALKREVTFGNGTFSMRYGPSFVFDTVTVRELDSNENFLTADKVTIHLALIPLLEKKIELRELALEKPRMTLTRDATGKLNCDDLLKPSADSQTVRVKNFSVKQGEVVWRDLFIQPQGVTLTFRELNLSLHNIHRSKKGNFKIAALISSAAEVNTALALHGTARLPDEGITLLESEINADIDIKKAAPATFWPYFGKYIPFPNTGGRIDLATSFKGTIPEFKAKGKLALAGASINWPSIFHHPVNPRTAQLDYELKLDKNNLDMPQLLFSADGFKVRGSCKLSDLRSKDIRITAKAASEPFILENLRQWIPYGIIADDASHYIEEHITGGLFRLETGSLDGRISQIVSMEKGTNYNILHIKGIVERGIVSYGKNVPSFNSIKGKLEMLGKDFLLSDVTGSFGGSPFSMSGKITDYPLDTPCQYPFQMRITPRPAEVAWLARLAGAGKLEFNGQSALNLTGNGFFKAYNLLGEWELKQAAYTFPSAVRKQGGTASHLAFSAVLGAEETRLTSMTYSLAGLTMSASATLKYGEEPYLGFELQTNPFLMSDTLPILPEWRSHQPAGNVSAHIIGKGNPEDFSEMDYSGSIILSAFSFAPGKGIRPVSNIEGSINFKGNSLETSSINVLYGASRIRATGRIKNLGNPEAEINLSSPELFLHDVSEGFSDKKAGIRNLLATLSIDNGKYVIKNLSGKVESTPFVLSGVYTGGKNPAADLVAHSSNLNLEELQTIAGKRNKSDATGAADTELKLKMTADRGKYGKILFDNLNAQLAMKDNVLQLQSLDASLYGGKATAKGKISKVPRAKPRYDLGFSLERINTAQLFEMLQMSRELIGAMNIKGELSAAGDNSAELKKTLTGNLALRLEKGSMRKFSVLSKVFSILNVSQLLKFQLPDMVSGGMPFNEIKGTIAVKDGVASSKDLLVNGDAINLSIIGSADIVKEELDINIGVKPLQTVDKIINRIPVVGWILTGKDDGIITAYFEAKGKWSDPNVKAIPVQYMAKGVLNIFRRVLELPVRIFTDTGDVILGK